MPRRGTHKPNQEIEIRRIAISVDTLLRLELGVELPAAADRGYLLPVPRKTCIEFLRRIAQKIERLARDSTTTTGSTTTTLLILTGLCYFGWLG